MNEQKEFYSPEQVGELLGLHARTVRRYIREGRLKGTRIGKQYRINVQDFNTFAGSHDPLRAPAPMHRGRRVLVSTTVDIEAISPEMAQHVTDRLSAAFNTDGAGDSGRHLDSIYYQEQGRLRIVINAELDFTNAALGLINVLANSQRKN